MINAPLRDSILEPTDITAKSDDPFENTLQSDESLPSEDGTSEPNTIFRTESNDDIESPDVTSVLDTSPTDIVTDNTESSETVSSDSVSESNPADSSELEPESTEESNSPEATIIPLLPELTKNPEIDPKKPMIVLSFDDGPSKYTDRLLDILDENGAKATFFLVGKGIDYRADTVRRIYNSGHDVGTHTWSHPELTRLTNEEVVAQITQAKEKLEEITGSENAYLVRPPYGSFNDEVRTVGAELGVVFVNWSVDTLDWKIKDADKLHEKIISSAKNGAIILCHDIHKTTVDAMETVIPKLIEDGYQLVTFTEMMAFSNDRLIGGTVYRMG